MDDLGPAHASTGPRLTGGVAQGDPTLGAGRPDGRRDPVDARVEGFGRSRRSADSTRHERLDLDGARREVDDVDAEHVAQRPGIPAEHRVPVSVDVPGQVGDDDLRPRPDGLGEPGDKRLLEPVERGHDDDRVAREVLPRVRDDDEVSALEEACVPGAHAVVGRTVVGRAERVLLRPRAAPVPQDRDPCLHLGAPHVGERVEGRAE